MFPAPLHLNLHSTPGNASREKGLENSQFPSESTDSSNLLSIKTRFLPNFDQQKKRPIKIHNWPKIPLITDLGNISPRTIKDGKTIYFDYKENCEKIYSPRHLSSQVEN